MLLSVTKSDGEPDSRQHFIRFLPTNEQGMLDYFSFVEKGLTRAETADCSQNVSLQSRTVIETVQGWTSIARKNLDEVDRILSAAAAKTPEQAEASKKKVTKKSMHASSRRQTAKKKLATVKRRAR